ncbi:MAG: ABC transporter ATP-binding protein [Bryobacteraceae bacterium]
MALIELAGVSKWFRRHTGPKLARERFFDWMKRTHHEEQRFYAVKDVSFAVDKGESVALVGSNGAGKSTILSMVAGLTHPDAGEINVNGNMAALMELGAGFHFDLTGAENLLLNASLIGLGEKRTHQLFDSIVDFAGLAEFIDEPLRTYSAGMVARLAFSVAVNVQADILIVDELLAVGDQEFHAKCLERMKQLRRNGQTLLFVSHSPDMVEEFCDRAIWMDHGEAKMDGRTGEVLAAYLNRMHHH